MTLMDTPSSPQEENGRPKAKKKRSWWWYLISALVTLVSIAILGRLILTNLDTLTSLQESARIGPLLLTFPLFFITEFLSSLAWGRIMNDVTRPLPMKLHQVIFFVTHAARRIPGTVWHVIGRVAWYERLGISKSISAFVNVVETILLIFSGVVVSIIFFPFISSIEKGQFWLLLGGVGLSIFLLRPKSIRFVMNKLGQQQYSQSLNYRKVLTWFALYPILWAFGGIILYLTINGLSPVQTSLIPICIAAWSIAGVTGMLVLLLPSGFGLSETALSLLLAPHISPGLAVTAAILMRILLTVYEFFFAGIFFTFRSRLSDSNDDGEMPH